MPQVLRYRRANRIAARVIDGAAFVVSVDQQRMVELNEVGTFIWEALEAPATVESLVAAVTEEFTVEASQARSDVETFLGQLEARGVVAHEREVAL